MSIPTLRKTLYLFFLLLLPSLSMMAQYAVSGRVTDSSGAPVEAAVFSFIQSPSGTSLQQGITDSNGKLKAFVEGEVQLYVSCLGFKPYLSAPFTVAKAIELPPIQLTDDTFTLGDVVVVSEQQTPSLKIEKGKMIFSPKNSSITARGTALDVLRKTPGVFVDGQNNISMGGKNSVLVILNGRNTHMQHDELVSLLKSTSSSSVSSIEVIQNPSAQYDAEGSGGVINIIMEHAPHQGLSMIMNNGLSYWSRWRQNTELSVGYTHKKLSLYANYSHSMGSYNLEYGMRRIQNGKCYDSPTFDTDKKKSVSSNLNIDYTFNSRHKLSARIDINTLFGPGITNTITDIYNAEDMKLEQTLIAQNDYYRQKGNRYGGNLFYVSTPREGERYSLDINYAWFDGCSKNIQPNKYLSPEGEILSDRLYRSGNFRNIHIFAAAYDQQHPILGGELKAGVKYSSVNADNGAEFYEIIDGQAYNDASQSNHFSYEEQIVAGYLLYTRPLGDHWTWEIGLRGEGSFSTGHLTSEVVSQNQTNHRNKFDLFPSASINWEVGKSHHLTLSYTKRIDRPAYQDLNPFEYMLDELSCWRGNPFLAPQKSHSVGLDYTWRNTSLSLSYTYVKDHKAQITDTVSTSKVMMIPRNVGHRQQISLSGYQRMNIVPWWKILLNLTGYYAANDIAFDEHRKFNPSGFAGIFSLQNTLHLPWKVMMELNGSLYTRHPGAANEYKRSSGYVDLGFSRKFADNKWSVSLAFRDIFWTSRWDDYSAYGDFKLWNWGKSESRRINLNVTYRFGKMKSRDHSNTIEEINRL